MLNLIIKDILVQKKKVLFSFAYVIFLLFAFQNMGSGMISSSLVGFTYMLMMTSCAYEEMNKADVMINSLPIKRSRVVAAKYLSIILYLVMGTLAYGIITFIISMSGLPLKIYPISLEGLFGGFVAVCLMTGLYFPLFFKVGYMKSKVINFILFFGFFFGFSSIAGILRKNSDSIINSSLSNIMERLGDGTIAFLAVCAVLLFFYLSYELSVKFYKSREF